MDTIPSDVPHSNPIPATSGVYKITCTANGRFYIGSAVNLQQRRRQHFSDLRLNKHHSLHMQRAWNKYGEHAFTFEVVEYVLPMSLTAREQYWLNKLKPFGRKGFNIAHDTISPSLGRKHTLEEIEKMKGRKASPETIEKLRQAKLGKKQLPEFVEKRRQANLGKKRSKQTPEHIEKLRQVRLGRKHTPETREKMSQAHLGYKHTPEAIANMSQARRAREKKVY